MKLTWREAALQWLQKKFARQDVERWAKTVQECECDTLLAEMKRCGIRVVTWARADPQDDYEWYGPGWFVGTNQRGQGVGFYIRDDDMAEAILMLREQRSGDYAIAIKLLETVCAEREAEKNE